MEIIVGILFSFLLMGFMAFAAIAAMKRRLRDLRDIVQFNIQGANPMVRLVPNISYMPLFLLIFSISTGGGDAFTAPFEALR